MGTKNNPGSYDCFANLAPDEPYFVLVAHDAMAPSLIRNWATIRQQQVEQGIKPAEDMLQVHEARQCAAQMEIWRADQIAKALKQPVPPRDTSSAPEPAPRPAPAEPVQHPATLLTTPTPGA